MGKREKVSIVRCSSYKNTEVKKALLESLKNLNFELPKNKTILIKPNLLAPAAPEKAITTHPVLVEELCKLLKTRGNKIIIGESSANDTDLAFKQSRMAKLSRYAKILNFESSEKRLFHLNHKYLKKLMLPKLLFQVDLIINMPKLKTHGLTKMTCCVKNLYGCIPGSTKMYYHKALPGEKKFCKFLIELHDIIKPQLNIVDGIIGLEGEGPGASGSPKKTNLIIASQDAIAADIVAAEVIGYKKDQVLTNKFGAKKHDLEIEKVGLKNAQVVYKKPPYSLNFLLVFYNLLPKPKISFYHDKCIRCGLCGKKCPVKAISYHPYPECNSKKCIRCLCCIEVCPKKAVYLKKDLARRTIEFLSRKLTKT